MSKSQVLHGTHNGVEILYYRGDVRFTLCAALDRYLQRLLATPGLRGFVIDLTEASSIDSTNLGILARLARSAKQLMLPKVTLISNQPDINEILEAVGFDEVFQIVEERVKGSEKPSEIVPLEAEAEDTSRLLLEAHRALMELNQSNRETFRDVVEAIEGELDR